MTKKKRKINVSQNMEDNKNHSSDVEMSERKACSLEEAIKLVKEGNIDSLKEIIENQPEIVNEKGEGKISLLHYAVAKCNKEMVKLLLEKGADIEGADYFGDTPLHITAFNLNLELIKFLVEKGANVRAVNEGRRNVLHSAASGIINEEGTENWEVIEYLLEKGVPADAVAEGEMSVSDIFRSKDWSYAEKYKETKEKVKSGEAKIKRNEKEKLKKEIEEILDCLMPEESSSDYELIRFLLETIVDNQNKLVENKDDSTARTKLSAARELAIGKNLESERIEELCQKVAELVEMTTKKRIEFVEVEGKPWMVKFNC